jgi:hypothetical protein
MLEPPSRVFCLGHMDNCFNIAAGISIEIINGYKALILLKILALPVHFWILFDGQLH